MNGITISPAEVRSTAGRIATQNRALEDTLNKIKSDMNALTATWQSKGAETTQQVFNTHAAKFAEYRQYIDNYSKFLENAATAYEQAEIDIDKGAGNFGQGA